MRSDLDDNINNIKHPFDIVNERFENGYYNELPPYSYSKDIATISYFMGICSKVDYEVTLAKYEMYADIWHNERNKCNLFQNVI